MAAKHNRVSKKKPDVAKRAELALRRTSRSGTRSGKRDAKAYESGLQQTSTETKSKRSVVGLEILNEYDFKERMSWRAGCSDPKEQHRLWTLARSKKSPPWFPCENSLGQEAVAKRAPEKSEKVHEVSNSTHRKRKAHGHAPDEITPKRARVLQGALEPEDEGFYEDDVGSATAGGSRPFSSPASVAGSAAVSVTPKAGAVQAAPASVAGASRLGRRLPCSFRYQEAPFALPPDPGPTDGVDVLAVPTAVLGRPPKKPKNEPTEDEIREELIMFPEHVEDPVDFERCKHLMNILTASELAKMKVEFKL